MHRRRLHRWISVALAWAFCLGAPLLVEAAAPDATSADEPGQPASMSADDVPDLGGPALTLEQWRQLQTTTDRIRMLDGPGWYPLMANAADWPVDLRAGAMIPDYQAISDNPDSHRGRLFLIEGFFARARDATAGLARPNDDNARLSEWAVRLSDRLGVRDTVLVYLTDPPPAPAVGARVVMPARFYMVWRDVDVNADGDEAEYLVFVGRSASVTAGPGAGALATGTANTGTTIGVAVTVAVIGAAFLWMAWRVRRLSFTPQPLERRRLRERDAPDDADADDEPEDPADLPADPADALATLSDSHALDADSADEPPRTPD